MAGEKHKEVIKSMRMELMKNLDLRDGMLIQELIDKDVIGQTQWDSIKDTNHTNGQQVSALISHLLRRSEKDFEIFQDCLQNHNHKGVSRKLKTAYYGKEPEPEPEPEPYNEPEPEMENLSISSGPMSEQHKEKLQKLTAEISKNAKFSKDFELQLYSLGVCDSDDLETLGHEKSQTAKFLALIQMLNRAADSHYYLLIKALDHSNQSHIADMLR